MTYRFQQRWSRGHKARGQGQGHKKNPRPRTACLFEDRHSRRQGQECSRQGQGPRTQAQVLSKKKKKVFTKIFQAISKKKKRKKGLHKNFSSDLHKKNVFQKIFQALHKILTIQKVVQSSSRDQGQGLDLRGQGQGLQNVSSRTPPLVFRLPFWSFCSS